MQNLTLSDFDQENYGGASVSEIDGVISLVPTSGISASNLLFGSHENQVYSIGFDLKLSASNGDLAYFSIHFGDRPLVHERLTAGKYWHQFLSDCISFCMQGGNPLPPLPMYVSHYIDGWAEEVDREYIDYSRFQNDVWQKLELIAYNDNVFVLYVDGSALSVYKNAPLSFPLSSVLIHQGSHTSRQTTTLQLKNVVVNELPRSYYYSLTHKVINTFKTTWSNKETKAQANPYPPAMQNVKPVEPVATLLGKSGNYQSLLNQQGEQRPVGYYQSTVMINKVPTAGKRVFCFTNNGQLRDETVSDVNGIYRFDHLDLNEKYMFVAQESNDRTTPPEYNAVASDWQTPTKYGE